MRFLFIFCLTFFSNLLWSQGDQNPCLLNQDFHIVILGSSTAAGTGPSSPDSTWVNRFRKHVQQINPANSITNLAIGGTTTYHIMPDWFMPPPNRPMANPNNNISQAIALEADAVIINMPSNDASNGFGIAEQMSNFLTITAAADSANIPIWVCTTQPKTAFENTQDLIQLGVRDSIFSAFGNMAIDFWNGIALTSNDINPIYDSGDGTHLNDLAHAILFERVRDKNILSQIFEASANVDFAFSKYSILNPNNCGDSSTIVQGIITNLGANNFDEISIQHDIYNSHDNTTTAIYDTIFGSLATCEADTFEFSINTTGGTNYSISSFLNTPSDTFNQNDTSTILFYSTFGTPQLTPLNDTICKNETGVLSVNFENADTIFWYQNLIDSIPIGGGHSLSTPSTNFSQTYFAEGIGGDLFFRNSIFTTNNSNKNWNGVMINLIAHEDLTIDSFSLKLFDAGNQEVVAYFKNGSYENFENTPDAWNLWGTDVVDVAVEDQFYTVNFGSKFLFQGDTLGIYFYLENPSARLSYNDLTDWASRSTDQLEVRSGSGITHTFSEVYFPRDWNGEVFYHYGFNPEGDCSSGRVAVEVVVSESEIDLGEDLTIQLNENISLDGGSGFLQYFWNGIEGSQFYNIDSTNFGIGIHEIILEAENQWGCFATDTVLITIDEPLGLSSQYFLNLDFQVFPNPTRDFFWIKNLKTGVLEIQLFDLFGKKILEKNIFDEGKILVNEFPRGIYFLKVKNKIGWKVQKILIE